MLAFAEEPAYASRDPVPILPGSTSVVMHAINQPDVNHAVMISLLQSFVALTYTPA